MAGEPVYLGTSGVLAFLDADDDFHAQAVLSWRKVVEAKTVFVMTDYVRLECWSLIQQRLGLGALADFHDRILPLCEVEVVGDAGFEVLARQVFLNRRRKVSLVDLSSFDCMLRQGIKKALAFDKHFAERGFRTP